MGSPASAGRSGSFEGAGRERQRDPSPGATPEGPFHGCPWQVKRTPPMTAFVGPWASGSGCGRGLIRLEAALAAPALLENAARVRVVVRPSLAMIAFDFFQNNGRFRIAINAVALA